MRVAGIALYSALFNANAGIDAAGVYPYVRTDAFKT